MTDADATRTSNCRSRDLSVSKRAQTWTRYQLEQQQLVVIDKRDIRSELCLECMILLPDIAIISSASAVPRIIFNRHQQLSTFYHLD